VQNHVEQNLESTKDKRDRIARVIKDSLVFLFPNQVDKNTKRDSSYSTNSIVSARRKTANCTINGQHSFMQMKPRFYHPSKKRGPWTTEK
jgi:hypothetical protein